jgi:NADPH-dependent ferric siderophore reductase
MRTYTPRHVDTAGRRLVVDFALHPDGGPATAWAASAAPGDSVVVTGGRGAYRLDPEAAFTVLAADETALPAVATLLDDAPEGARVLLFAEVADAGEQLRFDTAADLSTTWLHRGDSGGPSAGAGERAAAAIRAATFPGGPGRFWAGLEAAAMRSVRRDLIGDRGVPKDRVYTRAYWKYGTANHPDHDTGEDD